MSRVLVLCMALALLLGAPRAQRPDPALVAAFGSTAVQEGGRVKPISTVALWMLTRINGKASTTLADQTRLDHTEWFVRVLLFPERAALDEVFLVQEGNALDVLGLVHDNKSRRDRYSYAALAPAREKLLELYDAYREMEPSARTPVQQQIWQLASNLIEYEFVARHLDFMRAEKKDDDLAQRMAGQHLAIFPPPGTREQSKVWLSAIEVAGTGPAFATQKELVKAFGELVLVRDQPKELAQRTLALTTRLKELADQRGEYAKIPVEVTYYRLDLVYRSLYAFVLAFLLCAVFWLRPRSQLLRKLALTGVIAANTILITAIVLRCYLRGRPPVSTLYETVLFITAVGVLLGIVLELIQRRGLGVSVGALLGAIGVELANSFAEFEATDTMPSLVAVLDTNYWLATHVTAVTIGYAAGLLAAAIAHVYLLGKLFGWRRGDAGFYRGLSRTVYGVICFGLLFSVFGTIWGGVWANDSWGRFWGWDPKENGALLICLGEIAILHARMGGYLREHGICMAAIANGIIVSASWWGVNLLGIGLHSYAFTSGIWPNLRAYWIVQLVVLALGGVAWLRDRAPASVPAK